MKWDACKSTRLLEDCPKQHFVDQSEWLLDDLDRLYLDVILKDASPTHPAWRGYGQKYRDVANENADWYKQLFHERSAWVRRDRLKISLGRIAEGVDRTHESEKWVTSHDCIARSLVLGRLITGWQPEPIGDSPEEFSPADCVRTDMMGLDPINPIGVCVTSAIGVDLVTFGDKVDQRMFCGIDF